MVRVGHWAAVLFLAAIAVWMLAKSAQSFPTLLSTMRQTHIYPSTGGEVAFFVPGYFVAWLPALICAWGIWNWHRWGRALTIALCALGVFMELIGIILFRHAYFRLLPMALSLAALAMIVWLLLPSVRVQFHD